MVVKVIQTQYNKAEELLKDNIDKLHELAKYLYDKESITGDEFMKILNADTGEVATV
jgi:cell division protease FtsH